MTVCQDGRLGFLRLVAFHMAIRQAIGCNHAPHEHGYHTPHHLRSDLYAPFVDSDLRGLWENRERLLQSVAETVGESRRQSRANDASEQLARMTPGAVVPQQLDLIRSFETSAGLDMMALSTDELRSSERRGAWALIQALWGIHR
jgi:hypothetical protein